MTALGHVLILAGGPYPAREVSLRSAARLQDALREAGVEAVIADAGTGLIPAVTADPPSAVFPVIHGASGEDGSIQEVLTLLGVPYVGASPDACRFAFDKPAAKAIARRAGLVTPNSVMLPRETCQDLGAEAVLDRVVAMLGLPLFVKPARGGSALGATLVRAVEDLPAAMIRCFAFDDTALIEECVLGTEVAVGVIELSGGPEALPPVEICPRGGSYDHAAIGWGGGARTSREWGGGARTSRSNPWQTEFYVPARLSAAESKVVTEAAVTAHRALGLRDISRADLIISAGEAFFLEVNVTPGMTETSTLPMALDAAGRALGAVCRELLGQAAARGT
jgi:D-alanine-D-alanine ligase